jgi:hypothetical protein
LRNDRADHAQFIVTTPELLYTTENLI